MTKIAIVVHGGAGPDSPFIHKHEADYLAGLRAATDAGYAVLERGGTALDAVETAVRVLEDDPLFNAGRGSALTAAGTVEMCASLMDGHTRQSGAVAIVKGVRHPIGLARLVLDDGDAKYYGGTAASEFAQVHGIELADERYFITDHQLDELRKAREEKQQQAASRHGGTVGAVACDRHGHVAAATSTGGTENQPVGRIGDSSMIGVGAYADDRTGAFSSTGDGEVCIRAVLAYDVACAREYAGLPVRTACERVVHERNADADGDLGVIGVDAHGAIGWAFNSDRMHRGWRRQDDQEAQAVIWRV